MTIDTARTIWLTLTPTGNLHLNSGAPKAAGAAATLSAAAARRIEKAFRRGQGFGLLQLGAAEVTTSLPASLSFWRDFARIFVTRASTADLAGQRRAGHIAYAADETASLLEAAPPMAGGEYLSADVLAARWRDLTRALAASLEDFRGPAEAFLAAQHPVWNQVGRVHFHLAERKRDDQAPFAFLATYTNRVSREATVKHLPLGRALAAYAGARDRLLALLEPVQAAAELSPFIRELVDTGQIFHPLVWQPQQAYRFLQTIPEVESSGVVVRVPDWWKKRRPLRPQVQVTIGARKPSRVGLDAMLGFSAELVLDGQRLSARDRKAALSTTSGLALIKGQWVEIDAERLSEVLAHWQRVEEAAGDGLSFAQGMRLLAGADTLADDAQDLDGNGSEALPWSTRVAGNWLKKTLRALREPAPERHRVLEDQLQATLRPYQRVGVNWLYALQRLNLGGCLADDMGLGKTIQVISLLLILQRERPEETHLLCVPASLLGNWQAEIDRFAPGLRVFIAHSSQVSARKLAACSADQVRGYDAVITSYGSLARLPWARRFTWGLVVLDEAQAIKNPNAKQTRTVKALNCRARLALTGTPVENRPGDLWSLFDFINPGLLGTAKTFRALTKRLQKGENNAFKPLRKLIAPYILRRLKSDQSIIADLPDKTEITAYCGLSKLQAALYEQSVETIETELSALEGIQRRGAVLAFLNRFKQICNHPSQWLADDKFSPADSGKFSRLRELAESFAARQEKALVFTQFRTMTDPLANFLSEIYGRPGAVLHGKTPVKKRRALVERFQSDEHLPFMILSLRAGGTGLNLTAASHVVHFDRWWNPAVENQATDRAYRIGQKKNVLVHKFVCRGTIEEKIDALIEDKKKLSGELLADAGGETLITEMADNEFLDLISLDLPRAVERA